MTQPLKPNETMQFFSYAHLPPERQAISRIFTEVAQKVLALPESHERQKALDALLISKDAAVRASMVKPYEWDELPRQWVQQGATGPAIAHPRSTGA